eukprot:g15663.t1
MLRIPRRFFPIVDGEIPMDGIYDDEFDNRSDCEHFNYFVDTDETSWAPPSAARDATPLPGISNLHEDMQ